MSNEIRISDTQNIILNGKTCKTFTAHRFDATANSFIHAGKFSAPKSAGERKMKAIAEAGGWNNWDNR